MRIGLHFEVGLKEYKICLCIFEFGDAASNLEMQSCMGGKVKCGVFQWVAFSSCSSCGAFWALRLCQAGASSLRTIVCCSVQGLNKNLLYHMGDHWMTSSRGHICCDVCLKWGMLLYRHVPQCIGQLPRHSTYWLPWLMGDGHICQAVVW